MKKIIVLCLLITISALFWLANFKYPDLYLRRGFYTFLALTIFYFVSRLVFEEIVAKRIKEPKTRYSFRKTVSILYLVAFVVILIRVWVENTQTLIVSYGLIAAGLAVALQDFFKNFVGGIIIFVNGTYRVGDRIEVNSKYGDVIDIGILYTTLMEMKEWVAGDQATGRLSIIPNGYVLSTTVNNYTKDNDFIWDEITIPITYDSDWNEAIIKIRNIVKKETENIAGLAEKVVSELGEKYYLFKRTVEPEIFLTLTDNWITFNIRFISDVRERRWLHNKLSQVILNEIKKSEKIKIASTTLEITAFPEVILKQDKQNP
jgi:small-conductance mechanosensitive channel